MCGDFVLAAKKRAVLRLLQRRDSKNKCITQHITEKNALVDEAEKQNSRTTTEQGYYYDRMRVLPAQ